MRATASPTGQRPTGPTDEVYAHIVHIRQMLTGRVLADGLVAVVRLGIPDLLTDGPHPVAWLAQRCPAHEPSLCRLLRGLATFDVFLESLPGTFELTSLGRALCAGAPGSARAAALLLSGTAGAAAARLDRTIRTGRPPAEDSALPPAPARAGAGFADRLQADLDLRELFAGSAAAGLAPPAEDVFALDLPPAAAVVDVGGGDAAFLGELLTADPSRCGILLDLPHVAERAAGRLAAAGLADRCKALAGDMFDAVPGGGDTYLLRRVLHRCSDEQAHALLRACRRGMPNAAQLIVVDLLAADGGRSDPGYRGAALADLYVLALLGDGGRERTASELAALLAATGFRLVRMTRSPSGLGTLEATPAA